MLTLVSCHSGKYTKMDGSQRECLQKDQKKLAKRAEHYYIATFSWNLILELVKGCARNSFRSIPEI